MTHPGLGNSSKNTLTLFLGDCEMLDFKFVLLDEI